MLRGYARVSTQGQDLTLQIQTLKAAGCTKIYKEKISGAAKSRPKLAQVLVDMQEGDVLVVTRLDRLARSVVNLIQTVELLDEKNAGVKSLAEPWADSTTAGGKMVLTIFGGIAEFERELTRQRTQEGLEAAKARGVRLGRPPRLSNDQCRVAVDLIDTGQKSLSEVGRLMGVPKSTLSESLKRYREQNA